MIILPILSWFLTVPSYMLYVFLLLFVFSLLFFLIRGYR